MSKVTPEEIKQMNELYLSLHTYAGVAREIGRSASTVKRYIDPDYLEKKEKAARPLKKISWDKFTDGRPVSQSKKKRIFWLTEKPEMDNYYILQNCLPSIGIRTDKSYLLFPAEYLNLTFKDFINLCEEVCGAEIAYGKNKLYPSIYFKDNAPTRKLIETLNFLVEN